MSLPPEIVGSMRDAKWWETKKITEWKFESELALNGPLLEKLGPPIAVVNLEHNRSLVNEETFFVARSIWFGGGTKDIRDKSFSGLRKKCERAFRDIVIAHSQVTWSDWIEVQISGSEDWPDDEDEGERKSKRTRTSASLNVTYKILKRGKFPDGRDMVLDRDSVQPFPKAKKAREVRDGSYRDYHQSDDTQYAYIPATSENVAALRTLIDKMVELREGLSKLLGQGAIEKQLSGIARLALMERK